MEACSSDDRALTEAERCDLAARKSELRQYLRGLDDQRASVIRELARIDAKLYAGPKRGKSPIEIIMEEAGVRSC